MNVAECTPESVTTLFSSLFPVGVEASGCPNEDPSTADGMLAIYRNDEGILVSVCQTNLEFAARAGGALTMIPAGGCDDVIAEKELSSTLFENSREVMNLLVTLISKEDNKRVFLNEYVKVGDPVPDDVQALLGGGQAQVSMNVDFDRYGSGTISFFG